MMERGLVPPAAPRLAAARETVAAAFVLSAAAHAGLILWAVSGAPSREAALSAGSPIAIQVELVQGPDAPPAGGRRQNAGETSAQMADRAVAHDTKPPAEHAEHHKKRRMDDSMPGPSEESHTSFSPAPRPASAAAHQTVAPAATAPMPAAAQAVLKPPPPPRAKPTPPAPPGDAIAALDAKSGMPPPAAAETGRTVSRGSTTESDTQNGSEGMEGAAPRADNPAPEYPYIARLRGESGRVVLRVEVLASGAAGKVQVERSSGYDVLDQAALESVKRWRFLPARRDGRPVAATVRVPVRFALQ